MSNRWGSQPHSDSLTGLNWTQLSSKYKVRKDMSQVSAVHKPELAKYTIRG